MGITSRNSIDVKVKGRELGMHGKDGAAVIVILVLMRGFIHSPEQSSFPVKRLGVKGCSTDVQEISQFGTT